MNWRGFGFLSVGHQLATLVAPAPVGTGEELGLQKDQLASLARIHSFRELAQELPFESDPLEIRRIAWWGSAFADVALSATQLPQNDSVLREGALFNLGVSLFDSVLDEVPSCFPALSDALAPKRLRERLRHPHDSGAQLRCGEPSVSRLVALFDACLRSLGQRLRGEPQHLEYCSQLLRAMFESEVYGTPNALDAKYLPIRFIGALATGPGAPPVAHLFAELSQFFAVWDDWADLETDLLRLEANYFLAPRRPRTRSEKLAYILRSVPRVAGERIGGRRALHALATPLSGALEASKQLGAHTNEKVAYLCHQVLK